MNNSMSYSRFPSNNKTPVRAVAWQRVIMTAGRDTRPARVRTETRGTLPVRFRPSVVIAFRRITSPRCQTVLPRESFRRQSPRANAYVWPRRASFVREPRSGAHDRRVRSHRLLLITAFAKKKKTPRRTRNRFSSLLLICRHRTPRRERSVRRRNGERSRYAVRNPRSPFPTVSMSRVWCSFSTQPNHRHLYSTSSVWACVTYEHITCTYGTRRVIRERREKNTSIRCTGRPLLTDTSK